MLGSRFRCDSPGGGRELTAACGGASSTALVLTITEMLRKHGVVESLWNILGRWGGGVLSELRARGSGDDCEYSRIWSNCGIFPIDKELCAICPPGLSDELLHWSYV